MRIISITPDIDSGGAAKSLFVLARALAEQGHSLCIMSIAKPSRTKRKVEELTAMGVDVRFFNIPYFPIRLIACPIPFWKNVGRALARLGEFKRLAAEVRAFNPDVIHYNSYTTLHIASLLKGYKAVLHAREVLVEPAASLPLTRLIMKSRVARVIAISPEEREQASRLFSLPVSMVFNPPLGPLRYAPLPEDHSLVYGAFSHITPIKGQMELVKACAAAAGELRAANVQVRIWGGAVGIHQGYHDAVAEEIEQNGLRETVVFKGFTDQPEEEMKKCHLIVRPDAAGQPWGRDVIESLSMGRPVLATGSRQTFIRSGENGILVPPRDVDALARALVRLANRRVLREMSEAAFDFARRNLDPGINIGKTIDCLRLVAGQAE
ncbi:glycosyltransferase family 4 protein [Pseudodesulfovibrio thermohalotolerans]|uniref:glycosyltransferase family 4 protein n=1 Tax=Pseudodesulfovibrio thermohalotolerans TaxID=2880651 RepID=UPI0024414B37|nr:glycosyltransferase family 4 protein [Pseudodesulfovibrio thermohalotolerans]WFS62736.1 glycosyltransferase family 4 protein [Pseudodesulfovibrio thermohalotolerans]